MKPIQSYKLAAATIKVVAEPSDGHGPGYYDIYAEWDDYTRAVGFEDLTPAGKARILAEFPNAQFFE